MVIRLDNNKPLIPLKKSAVEIFLETIPEDWNPSLKLWLDFKKEKGQKYKGDIALQQMFKKLKILSAGSPATAMLIVEQSISANYSGLFELKQSKSDHSATNYKKSNSYADRF